MKVVVEAKALAGALNAVSPVVAKSVTIPILAHALIEANGGTLAVTGTDMEMRVTATVPAQVEKAGGTTVLAARLGGISKHTADGAQIRMSLGKERLTVTDNGSRYQMATLPAGDYPVWSKDEPTAEFQMPATDLHDIVSRQSFISNEELRHYLCGIYLAVEGTGEERELCAVETDGHSLLRLAFPLPTGAGPMPSVILPKRAVTLLAAWSSKPDRTFDVAVTERRVNVRTQGLELTTRLIEGTYPDYQRVIPPADDQGVVRIEVPSAALARAVAQAHSTLAGSDTIGVRLSPNGAALQVSARTHDSLAEMETEVEASIEGDGKDIGVDVRKLDAMLAMLPATHEMVRLQYAGAGSPIRVTRPDNDAFVGVIMPLNLGRT